MAQEDMTVQLPGDREAGGVAAGADRRYASDRHGEEVPERGFGVAADAPGAWGSVGDPTLLPPGEVSAGPPPGDEDRTQFLGAETWSRSVEPGRSRDRLLVHVVWEILLLVLVAGIGVYCYRSAPGMFEGAGRHQFEFRAAWLGALAIAMSLSVRAATPNLAVGAFAAVSATVFVRDISHGAVPAAVLAVGVAALAGLALGLVVGVLHVPGWTASLVALCGGFVTLAVLGGGTAIALPVAAQLPDPVTHSTLWLGAVVVVSVLFGLFGLVGPVRRWLGSFRTVAGDPADRRVGSGFVAALVLMVSSGIAGAAGVFGVVHTRAVGTYSLVPDLLLALGAVLVGGVSAFGRRGGLFGTMLGVVAVTLLLQLGVHRGWPAAVSTYAVAGGAVVFGLIVTRLVEWAGRDRAWRSY